MQKTLSYAALVAALAIAGPTLAQSTSSPASQPGAQPTPPSTTAPGSTTSSPASPSSTAPSSTTTDPDASAAPSSSTAPASSGARTGSTPDTAANAGAEVTSGMSVKDSTGAPIGQIIGVKAGVATIKMGADSFSVDTSKLGVANGAATINATQAEIKKMMPKK